MGYVTKDIAVIIEPQQVTLAGSQNFTEFKSKPAAKVYLSLKVEIKATNSTAVVMTLLKITPPSGLPSEYKGTPILGAAEGSTFYLAAEPSGTAENLRQALLLNTWFKANFEITIPPVWQGKTAQNGTILHIVSKGAGEDYNINIEAPNDTTGTAYAITWINRVSRNNDSISGEAASAEVCLEVYSDPCVKLGQDDRPIDPGRMGRHIATLSKTYAGDPIWFDTNAIFAQHDAFNRPPSAIGWFDAGTCQAYRFAAKIKAANSLPFYLSNALYVLNGRGGDENLAPYVYNGGGGVKLLTNKPATPYVRGQREYLTFIFSEIDAASLSIVYRAYGTNGVLLGVVYDQKLDTPTTINTCVLDIDTLLDKYPTTGIVRVALTRDKIAISNDLEYSIRPDCLHSLREFIFLNRLGGWDAFNFDATVKIETKPTVGVYSKVRTPTYRRGDSLETVYNASLANTFTVEGAPVTDKVADWLKELASSRAVFDGDGNYIIIEEFTLAVTDFNKNMHRPTIKYRISE